MKSTKLTFIILLVALLSGLHCEKEQGLVKDDTSIGETKVTIDGSGRYGNNYSNETVIFSSDDNRAEIAEDGEWTRILAWAPTNETLYIRFKGLKEGTYTWPDFDITFEDYAKSYYGLASDTLIVTKYEKIGGIIEGTYTAYYTDKYQPIDLNFTDGCFSVPHVPLNGH